MITLFLLASAVPYLACESTENQHKLTESLNSRAKMDLFCACSGARPRARRYYHRAGREGPSGRSSSQNSYLLVESSSDPSGCRLAALLHSCIERNPFTAPVLFSFLCAP